jgi:hypothetical protein
MPTTKSYAALKRAELKAQFEWTFVLLFLAVAVVAAFKTNIGAVATGNAVMGFGFAGFFAAQIAFYGYLFACFLKEKISQLFKFIFETVLRRLPSSLRARNPSLEVLKVRREPLWDIQT